MLADGENLIFEATSIIEYLASHHPGPQVLVPTDPDAAIAMRMLDRVFDNYVMNADADVVGEHIRNPAAPDEARIAGGQGASCASTYAWLEGWLEFYPVARSDHPDRMRRRALAVLCRLGGSRSAMISPASSAWRAHLLALPPVARCIEDARPYRANFPPGAPDRD